MLRLIVTLPLLLLLQNIFGQNISETEYSFMFYNVENLFDCKDDTLTRDEEFTFDGAKHWSYNRYKKKLNDISRVIKIANGWNTPTLVGLCEVENETVLKGLLYETGLNQMHYRFIHYDSPDKRGIDVALLYQSTVFQPIESYPIRTSDPNINFYTRDALYCKGILNNQDTIHIIVNHWPSMRGGVTQSEGKRIRVATMIKAKTDSIINADASAKVIVMGDFNAEIESTSLQLLLENKTLHSYLNYKDIKFDKIPGSHKYQGHWSVIDHILISSGLLESKASLNQKICGLDFLLEEDKTYSGAKPNRTYAGPRYKGGTSDHLPVLLTVTPKQD